MIPLDTIDNGWLQDTTVCPSPNYNERPATTIDLLVIHNISLPPGTFGGPHISELFTNCLDPEADPSFCDIADLRVSAHILIRRDGSCIQFVPFDMRAWHAGVSCWQGRTGCNDFSIGIELEGADDIAFDDRQYEALIRITKTLFAYYPSLSPATVVGHSDIAPGRKTDPGPAFDWQRYLGALA